MIFLISHRKCKGSLTLASLEYKKAIRNKNLHYLSKGERLRVNTRTETVQQIPSCKKDSNREHGICGPKKSRIMKCLETGTENTIGFQE